MSQTIYARVPDHVKEAAEQYASTRGLTLASAVTDLLDRGLQAADDERSVAELERRAAELGAEVEALRERERTMSSTYEALAQRMVQPVGACPKCGDPISGHDLLVVGRCPRPECGSSLTSLLGARADDPAGRGSLDDGEFKMLIGALGLLLGITYLSGRSGGLAGGG